MKLTKIRDNSAIYEPISMKFETQVLIDMVSWKISKPWVPTGNKMAADTAILEKLQRLQLGHLWTDFDEIWNTGTYWHGKLKNLDTVSADRKQDSRRRRHLGKTRKATTRPFMNRFWWNLKHRYLLACTAWKAHNGNCLPETIWLSVKKY